MRLPLRPALVAAVVVLLGGLLWFGFRGDTAPIVIAPGALARWTLIVSDGTDPWVVAAKPPDALMAQLVEDASRRAGRRLVTPSHPALPLVLRSESDEGLQGVYPTDSVLRMARGAGVDDAVFQPICLAHRVVSESTGQVELYFSAFESAAFNQFRLDLVPPIPEHAGIGIYEPGAVTPVLIVGATDANFDRWWPLRFDRARDCRADLNVLEPSR